MTSRYTLAMSSIGGGGGRVGGPQGPLVPPNAPAEGAKKPDEAVKPAAPNDGFERGGAARKATEAATPGPALKVEGDQKFNELLQKTRNDPKAMLALANTLSLAYARFAGDFGSDKAKASTLLDHLAQARFAHSAVENARGELASLRERMSVTKHRMAIQKRRLHALRQLAGRVNDTRVADEVAGLEAQVALLQTQWAESFVALGLGKVIYAPGHEETPEHLKRVVKTTLLNTKRNQDAGALGELMSEIHPARAVSHRAARELDGKDKRVSQEVLDRVRKEARGAHGRTMQAFAALYELFEQPADPNESEE